MNSLYSRVDKLENGCWEFNGALRSGYGAIKVKGKVLGAHRVSYELSKVLIPKGLFVCHKCDNSKCINPEHLFLGSQKDNMQDCKSKGRFGVPNNPEQRFKIQHYPKNTKIPLEKAILIKEEVLSRGEETLLNLSKKHHVPYQYIRDISRGKILKNR